MFVLRFTSAFVLVCSVVSANFDCYPCECKSEDCDIIEADCSTTTTEIQIDEIPEYLSSLIGHLDLTGQLLKVLEENVFENANLTGLKKLTLQHCQINKIHKDAFANMNNLTYLDASGNNMTHINTATFFSTTKLKTLDLSFNLIQDLRFSQNLTHLETLLLNNNNITYLGANLFNNNTKLESLQLSNNKIEILPDKLFNNLNNLRYLHLSFNRISRIPNNLFQSNSKLRTLLLEYNAIDELSDNLFDNVTGLDVLDLEQNKIRKIPENIFRKLANISIIQLKSNELESIPNNTFKNLSKLHTLNLSHNQISSINTGFVEYSSCSNGIRIVFDLLLSHNKIRSLPSGVFKKSCRRTHIDLSYNKIATIDSNAFLDTEIINLNLAHNKISFLSGDTFKNINILDLSFNNVSILPAGIFDSVNFRLNLNNNNITSISSKWFGSNEYATLLLANNSITYFDLNITNFKYLDLLNNPIICDCKLKKQHELLTRKSVRIQCSSPLSLKNKNWNILDSNQFVCQPEIRENFTQTINGSTYQISCKVYALPAPDIHWLKYNQTIQENDSTTIQTKAIGDNYIYWYNLTFSKEATDFAGQYSCVLNNSAGGTKMNFTVLQQVQPKPKPREESSHAVEAIWITVVVVILSVLLVTLLRVYRKRRLRNTQRSGSITNVLYDPMDSDDAAAFI